MSNPVTLPKQTPVFEWFDNDVDLRHRQAKLCDIYKGKGESSKNQFVHSKDYFKLTTNLRGASFHCNAHVGVVNQNPPPPFINCFNMM